MTNGKTSIRSLSAFTLKPRFTAQIEYAEWTNGNQLRHSKFVAIRDDKDVGDVGRESPTTR